MLGYTEILIILVIGVIIYNGKRLPELGSGIGQAIKNFKKAMSEPDEIEIKPEAKPQAELKDKTPETAEHAPQKSAETQNKS